jgi:hypothetical protein
MTGEDAEGIAIAALCWVAADAEVLGAFLSSSGLDPATLRSRAGDPGLLGAVLDHVMTRDDWVIAVANEAGIRPERIAMARAALPGGALPHWT